MSATNYTVFAVRKSQYQFKVGCFLANQYEQALIAAFAEICKGGGDKYVPVNEMFGLYGVSTYMGQPAHGKIMSPDEINQWGT